MCFHDIFNVLLVPIKSILAKIDFVATYEYLSVMDSLSIYTKIVAFIQFSYMLATCLNSSKGSSTREFDNHKTHYISDSTHVTFYLVLSPFYCVMLVYCVFFTCFPGRTIHVRNQNKNNEKTEKRPRFVLMTFTMMFSMALAMT